MRSDPTLDDFASLLRRGRSLALVETPSLIAGNADLRSTIRVGGSLFDVVVFTSAQSGVTVPFNFEDPKAVLLPVATILQFLHCSIDARRALVHGNLNIGAVSVVNGTVVVSGFEHCGIHPVPPSDGKDWARRTPGHLPSMAPELVESGIRTTQTDVYAFGMLMFRMFAAKDPFDEISSRYDVACAAKTGAGQRPPREDIQHEYFNDGLWALMNECWTHEPSARPTMATIRARLAQMA